MGVPRLRFPSCSAPCFPPSSTPLFLLFLFSFPKTIFDIVLCFEKLIIIIVVTTATCEGVKGAVIVNGIVLSLTLAPRPQVGHTHVDDVGDEADDDDGDDDANDDDNDGDADDADHVW